MFLQSISGVLNEITTGLSLASILYPLDRIQSIKQIKPTYSDPEIKEHKSMITRSIHNGIKTFFRGYMPFITKIGILNLSVKFTEFGIKNKVESQNALKLLNLGFSTVGYFLTYPFQIVNIRMSTELERERFYTNTRQCISKIKKNQGIKTLYRGFFLGYTIFAAQFLLLQELQANQNLWSQMTQQQKIGANFGAIAASQVLLYPLTTLLKMYQINGAMGHTDQNFNIRAAFRHSKFTSLWRGFQLRVANLSIFTLLYFTYFDGESQAK